VENIVDCLWTSCEFARASRDPDYRASRDRRFVPPGTTPLIKYLFSKPAQRFSTSVTRARVFNTDLC